jgi:IS30 family transposase
MKTVYNQLSSEERDKIAILRAQGLSLEKIAQAIISPSKLKTIENLLNNRPRKCLTFKTPAEIFSSYVALAG